MKKQLSFFIVFGFVLAVPSLNLYAQKPFEGTITWRMSMPATGNDEKFPVTVNFKGKKMEMEMDMGTIGMIKTYADEKTKKAFIVMEAMKTGYSFDMPGDSPGKTRKSDDSPDPIRTGRKEIIAGHPAEEYIITELKDIDTIYIWEASDFPKDMVETLTHSFTNNPNQDTNETKAMKLLAAKGLVTVRVVAKSGKVPLFMEFVKYERKKLRDSLFVPSSDIQYIPMPKTAGGGVN